MKDVLPRPEEIGKKWMLNVSYPPGDIAEWKEWTLGTGHQEGAGMWGR